MTDSKKGSVTIFLALVMLSFLLLCLVLVEGTRVYFLRVKAAQAIELAEFSVLSEYQQELFKHYGLFFIDLDYEQGSEQTGVLEQRIGTYLGKNAEELTTRALITEKYCRATDAGGSGFFRQAVEMMKVQSGYHFFEEVLGNVGGITLQDVNLGEILEKHENTAKDIVSGLLEDENTAEIGIKLPNISFPSVDSLTEAVFGSKEGLSEKGIDLSERIGNRSLSEGIGAKDDFSVTDMQLFHKYIFQKFSYYGSLDESVWKDSLEYQLEYIISGRESDLKNLENVMWRIFLLRAGGNYLFYHQDSQRLGKARAEAVALAGFLGNTFLIEAVKEMILISQAIEDGIVQTKQVFAGEKVPLYQNGAFAGILLGYEEYLYLFLNTTNREEKIYRCMDIVEMEVRKKSGYPMLRMDHCMDCFEVTWKYQFDSLFMELPVLNGGIYENTITRKFYYEN